MAAISSYVPLWCKSNYSFLEGASHPEELISQATFFRLPAIALTDRHGVYGLPRAHQRVLELESTTKLLSGTQLTIPGGHLLVLVQNQEGWKNMCRLVTAGARRSGKGENLVSLREVAYHSRGLLALWGGDGSSLYDDKEELWREQGEALKDAFGDRVYALITRHKLASQPRTEPRAEVRAHRLSIPLVAGREVLYHKPSRRRLQDVVTSIRHGVPLERAGTLLRPNDHYSLLPEEEFLELFRDRPEAVRRQETCPVTLQPERANL